MGSLIPWEGGFFFRVSARREIDRDYRPSPGHREKRGKGPDGGIYFTSIYIVLSYLASIYYTRALARWM